MRVQAIRNARSMERHAASTNQRASSTIHRAPKELMNRIKDELGVIRVEGDRSKGIAPFSMLRTPLPIWVAREFVLAIPKLFRVEVPSRFEEGISEVIYSKPNESPIDFLQRIQWADPMTLTSAHFAQIVNSCQYYRPDLPVTHITWNESRLLAAWLGGRLPTEPEWNLAAGSDWEYSLEHRFRWRETDPFPVIVCKRGDESRSNARGFSDMVGNVWEHVDDLLRFKGWSLIKGRVSVEAENPSHPDAAVSSIGLRPVWSHDSAMESLVSDRD